MGQLDLAVFVREQKCFRALEDTEPAALETRGVFPGADAFAAGFDTDHPNRCVVQERMEKSDGVAAAADAGDKQIRQPLFALKDLPARFDSDDAMKIAHHHRVGMRCEAGAEN